MVRAAAQPKDESYCIGIGQTGRNARRTLRCDGRIKQDYQFLGTRYDNQIKVNNGTGLCLKVTSTVDIDGSRTVYQGSCNDKGPTGS